MELQVCDVELQRKSGHAANGRQQSYNMTAVVLQSACKRSASVLQYFWNHTSWLKIYNPTGGPLGKI
jgi:hypothetical protein